MDELSPRTTPTLNSWKEIAVYLGRGVRTVQRWEEELGLPVRRIRDTNRSPVFAFERDLQAWLQRRRESGALAESSPHPGRFRHSASYAELRGRARAVREGHSTVHERARAAREQAQELTSRIVRLIADQRQANKILQEGLQVTLAALLRQRTTAGHEVRDSAWIVPGPAGSSQLSSSARIA